DGGDPEVAVRVDLESVGDVPVRQGVELLLGPVGPTPPHLERVRLDPDDRAVRLRDDAVRVDVAEILDDLAVAARVQSEDVARMRLRLGLPVARVREVEAPVGSEREVVRAVEAEPFD